MKLDKGTIISLIVIFFVACFGAYLEDVGGYKNLSLCLITSAIIMAIFTWWRTFGLFE